MQTPSLLLRKDVRSFEFQAAEVSGSVRILAFCSQQEMGDGFLGKLGFL